MSQVGKLVYKCRMCGSLTRPYSVPDVELAMVCITLKQPLPEAWGRGMEPRMTEVHHCILHHTKQVGVMDLIGAEYA